MTEINKNTLKFFFLILVLILVQVVGLNHFCLYGLAMAFAYIYVILHLPLDLNQNWVLTIGFFIGLIIDIFSDTIGICALSCTIISALRKPVLRLYLLREEDLIDPCPSMASLGFSIFAKYAFAMSLIYCTCVYVIESFSFFHPIKLIPQILASALLTWIVLLVIDSIVSRSNDKRS